MTSYYNEHDPYAAAWLRNLIAAGHIAPGEVDERSIEDVRPDELAGFTQCHFFAGIGVWSLALRNAGWPDDRPIWTGSCPCQPFSAAGQGGGFDDERHLWPAFFHLIGERRPLVVIGEQVASKDGLGWLDLVSADVEGAGYAFGATDTCAAGYGAPHIRQRLYWLAHAHDAGPQGRHREDANARGWEEAARHPRPRGAAGGLADAVGDRRHDEQGEPGEQSGARERRDQPINGGDARWPGPANGPWGDADWLLCRDGKWRPVESGTFPLAHGAPSRVGRLRAYGNAIVEPQARAFAEAVQDILHPAIDVFA